MVHAVWSCPEISGVWNSSPAWSFRNSQAFPTFIDLVRYITEKEKDLAQFAIFIWMLWYRRNRLRTEDKPFPLTEVIPLANQLRLDFLQANTTIPMSTSTVQQEHVQWIPPDHTTVKANFNGAVFRDSGKAGVGVIIRDSHGQVLASMSEKIVLSQSVTDVEAIAAFRDGARTRN